MTQFKVRSLFAELGFKIKNMKEAQDFEDAVENIRAGMERVISVARTSAIAITGAATALTVFETRAASNAAELLRMAQGVGIHTNQLQELSFAYGQLGIDQAELLDSFQKVSDRVEKASKGSKEYERAIKLTGNSSKELIKLPMQQMYDSVLNGIIALEDPQKRLAALTGVFGETLARKLSPALAENGKLLQEYTQIAAESGMIMSEEQLAALSDLDKSFKRIKATMTAVKNVAAVALAPIFSSVTARVLAWYRANQDLVKSQVVEFVERLSDAVETAYGNFKVINRVVQEFGGWFRVAQVSAVALIGVLVGRLGVALSFIAGGISKLFTAITSAAGAKAAAIFLIIAGAILTIASAVDELAAQGRGAETFLENLIKKFDDLGLVMKVLAVVLNTARLAVMLMMKTWEHAMLPGLMKLRPILKFILVALGMLAAVALAFVGGFVAISGGMILALGLIVEAIEWMVDMAVIGFNWFLELFAAIGKVFLATGKVMLLGLDPALERLREMKLAAADLLALLGDAGVDSFLGSFMGGGGFSLKAMAADIRAANANPTGTASTAAAAAPSAVTQGPVVIEQQNTFNVSGSMDDRTGRKVVDGANKASRDAANSINNAARAGNR